jgi:RimJ/RimL family protein N-acetyltransferase
MKCARGLCIKGEKVWLYPLRRRDINRRYLSWLKDGRVTRFMETRFAGVTRRDLLEFYRKMRDSKNDIIFAIAAGRPKRHIGNIKLGRINWVHRYADLGIMIGDRGYWGKGCGQEACRLVADYAFNVLKLNKIILGVYGNHASAIRAYKKAGFNIEGRIKDLCSFEGRYVDKVIMGISKR